MNDATLRQRLKGAGLATVGGALGVALALLIAFGHNNNTVHTGAGVGYLNPPAPVHPGG